MSLKMLVEAQRDDRSFRRVADEAEDTFARAGRDAGDAFDRGLGSRLGGITGSLGRVGRDAGTSFKTEFSRGINEAVAGFTSQFGAMGRVAESTFSAMPGKATIAAAGVAGIGLAAVTAGKQLYDLGAAWDSIADGITVRTGKVGAELEAMTDMVGRIGSTTAAPLESISEVLVALEQGMPALDQNSAAAERLGSNLAYLNANGQAVDVLELGRAFTAMGVGTSEAVSTLDNLVRASQATGIPLSQLVATVQNGAPQFSQFGLDIGEATAFLASFERAGLDSAAAVTGLKTALRSAGSEEGLAARITEIKELLDLNQRGAAVDLAGETFGTRNMGPFLDAIERGVISGQNLKKVIDDVGLSVADMQDATDDGEQGWQKLVNTVKDKLGPAADYVFGNINTQLQLVTGNFTSVEGAASRLETRLAEIGSTPIDPNSALGRMLAPGGGPAGSPGVPAQTGIGSAFGAPATPGGSGGSLKPYSWGSDVISPPASSTSSRSSGPTMPVLPYSGDPLSLLQGFTPTASLYSAAESVLGARHARAQAEAELNALEASNEATAEQIQTARNKLVEADSNIVQTELRLQEAKISATEKYTDTLKDATGQLGEIGAALDRDFGISKGLAGIAENITKFVGNLIAAPFLTQMGAIAAASPSQGGYGAIGIAAAQGAFGPEFTGIDYSAPSALGPTALRPGLPGGAPTEDQVKQIAAAFGLQVTSEDRPGDPGYHGRGMALDLSNGTGNTPQMRAFADYMRTNFGPYLKELIYSAPGFTGINNGKPHQYSAGTLAEHTNHVHVAADWGSSGAFTGSTNFGNFGAPGSKQATANMIYQQALARGYSAHEATSIVAYAIGESGLNAGISGGAQGGSGSANEVIGLFQQKPAFAIGGGIDPSQRSDPVANTYAYLNQLEKNRHLPIEQALPATSVGGPLATGAGAQPQSWAPLYSQAQGLIGGGGGSMLPGTGMPQAAPFGGPGVGPTQIGGVAPPGGIGGGGGIGITPGGTIDTAMQLGGAALDVMAPGAGQAAQTGIKLANRAIQYGGEVAGILASGWMETFLPTGGSELANRNWATRIIGGLAGAGAAIPNVAGKSAQQISKQGDPNAHGQGASPGPGNTHIEVHNQRATEDGTGRDIAWHMQERSAMPAMP